MKTIQDVRADLKYWGNFWARQEQGQGYAKKSNIEALRETLQRGCAVIGTSYLNNMLAENIKVPDDINKIGIAVNSLSIEHRIAIRVFYVNAAYSKKTFTVQRAEIELTALY